MPMLEALSSPARLAVTSPRRPTRRASFVNTGARNVLLPTAAVEVVNVHNDMHAEGGRL